MPKILVLNWRSIINHNAGGAEIHCYKIFNIIAKRGYRVQLVASCDRTIKHDEITIDKVHVSHVTKHELLYPLFSFYALRKRLMRGFDVVVEDVSKVPIVWPLFASKLLSKPFVIIIHHVHGKIFFRELHPLLALALFLYELFTLKLYSLFNPFVVTVSKSTRRELLSLGFSERRIKIVYSGIDFDLNTLSLKRRKAPDPLIVYVGRVKKYKRLGHLVRAMKIVLSKIPNAKLIVAGKGDGNVYKELKSLAKRLGISSNVEFLGEINEEKKREILQRAWVFVATSMKEGFGISVLEAQAFGTPIVAYNVPGLRDSVKHLSSGVLVKDSDVTALANACTRILGHDILREKLSKGALKHALTYNWDISAKQFLALLTKMIHGYEQ